MGPERTKPAHERWTEKERLPQRLRRLAGKIRGYLEECGILEAQELVSRRKHGSCMRAAGGVRKDVDQEAASGFSNKVGPARAISGAWWGRKQIAVG